MTDEVLAPVVKERQIAAPPEIVFRRFTDGIGEWWPLETHSVFGERATAARFEGRKGGRLYELDPDGDEADWGTVEVWDPPRRVIFTWHPGRSSETAQRVEVTFDALDQGTAMKLIQTGWENLGAKAAETRGEYDRGWEPVLGRFEESMSAG